MCQLYENFISGYSLDGTSYVHPIYKDKIQKFFRAAHITASKGTGLVHIAPAHGPDDFLVSLNYKIPIVSIEDYYLDSIKSCKVALTQKDT